MRSEDESKLAMEWLSRVVRRARSWTWAQRLGVLIVLYMLGVLLLGLVFVVINVHTKTEGSSTVFWWTGPWPPIGRLLGAGALAFALLIAVVPVGRWYVRGIVFLWLAAVGLALLFPSSTIARVMYTPPVPQLLSVVWFVQWLKVPRNRRLVMDLLHDMWEDLVLTPGRWFRDLRKGAHRPGH